MYKYIYMLIQRSYTFIPTVITRLRAYLLTLNARALVTHPPSATVATVKLCAFFHVLHFFCKQRPRWGHQRRCLIRVCIREMRAAIRTLRYVAIWILYVHMNVSSNSSSTKRSYLHRYVGYVVARIRTPMNTFASHHSASFYAKRRSPLSVGDDDQHQSGDERT